MTLCLLAEIQKRDIQIRNNNTQIQRQASEIEALRSGMAKLQIKLKTRAIEGDMLSRQVTIVKYIVISLISLCAMHCD